MEGERTKMLEKLQAIIRRYTDNEEIAINNDTVLLNDLGLNSYELVQIICEVENEFEIEIPDRSISSFKTVRNLLDYIIANK